MFSPHAGSLPNDKICDPSLPHQRDPFWSFFVNDVKPGYTREEHVLRSTLGEQGDHPYVNRRPTSGVPSTPGSCYLCATTTLSFIFFLLIFFIQYILYLWNQGRIQDFAQGWGGGVRFKIFNEKRYSKGRKWETEKRWERFPQLPVW